MDRVWRQPNGDSGASAGVWMAMAVGITAIALSGCGGGRGRSLDGGTASGDAAVWQPPSACEGRELGAPGVLDLDLPLISISGVITVDGRPLTGNEASVAVLELHERDTNEVFTLAAPSVAAGGAYTLVAPPGRYEITYRGLPTCETAPGLPCNAGVIVPDLTLTSSGVLDLDLPTARADVRVTVDGVPATDGLVVLEGRSAGRGDARATIRAGGAVLRVLRGSAAIAYEHDDCTGPMPCGRYAPGGELTLETDGALDLEVPVVHVAGAAWLDGVPAARGLFVFFESESLRWESAVTGGAYAATIVPGTYAIGYDAPAEDCRAGGLLPCAPAFLREPLALTADGVLDLDADLVHVAGAVRDGETPLVSDGAGIRVVSSAGDGTTRGITGAWGASVVAGSYTLRFDGDESECARATGNAPCNDGPLLGPIGLTSDGALDLDVPVVHIAGRVISTLTTLSTVRFEGAPDLGDLRAPITGGAYAVRLLVGRYAVEVSDTDAGCDRAWGYACFETRVQAETSLAADGVLDLSLDTFPVTGALRVGPVGGPLAPTNVGYVHFRSIDGLTRGTASLASGAYAMPLVARRYLVTHRPDVACSPALPCGDAIVDGCPALRP